MMQSPGYAQGAGGGVMSDYPYGGQMGGGEQQPPQQQQQYSQATYAGNDSYGQSPPYPQSQSGCGYSQPPPQRPGGGMGQQGGAGFPGYGGGGGGGGCQGDSYGGGFNQGGYDQNRGFNGCRSGGGMSGGFDMGGGMNNGGDNMGGGYGGGYNGGCYGGGYNGYGGGCDGERYGWRQEYSVGNVPEYQAESLWSGTAVLPDMGNGDAEAAAEAAEVHVFGPSGEQVPPAILTFEQASQTFPQAIIQRLQGAGFQRPTPIQAHTWAITTAGRDVIGIAKTGSGKTLAFLLPGFIKLLQARTRPPSLVVLAPTRELACQIEQEADKFGRSSGIRTACCYGGAPRGQQLGAIRRGAQVVVACPGRLNDFLQNGAVHLNNVSYLVLDEADRMLDMGFEPQIRSIIQQIPETRQTLLFTATWPKEVRSLASEFLTRPIHVQTGAVDVLTVNKDIEQHVCFVQSEQDKGEQLITILRGLGTTDRCLIFCEMKRSAEVLANELMNYHGLPAVRIHGDMAQYERTAALEAFKSGRSPVMVATDVAARGIDVKGVTCVINYDSSGSAKDYVHRIGRTGRAGQKGIAYTFLMPREERKAQDIIQVLQRSNLPIPPELQGYVQHRRPGGGKKGGKGKGFGKGKGGGKGKGPPRSGGKGFGFGGGGGGKGYGGGNHGGFRGGGGGGGGGFGGGCGGGCNGCGCGAQF